MGRLLGRMPGGNTLSRVSEGSLETAVCVMHQVGHNFQHLITNISFGVVCQHLMFTALTCSSYCPRWEATSARSRVTCPRMPFSG